MTDLEARLATLKRHRDHYALVNLLLRQGNDQGLRTLGYTDEQIGRLREPDARGRIGFAGSAENTRKRIHRLRRRIGALVSCG